MQSTSLAKTAVPWMPLVAVFVAWAIVAQLLVPDIDHGVFLWVGHVMRAGGLPYVDSIETKGPIAHLLWALAFSVGPAQEYTLRAFDALLWVGAMLLAGVLARRAWPDASRHTPFVAAALLGATHLSAGFGNVAQPDEWGGWLVLASTLIAARARSWRGALCAGAAVACAAGIKPSFAIFGAVPWLVLVWPDTDGPGKPRAVTATVALMGGSLLVLALVVGWFASVGALDELLDVHLRFNLEAYAPQRSEGAGSIIGAMFRELPLAWVVLGPFAAVGAVRLWRAPAAPRAKPIAIALVAWLVLALLNTAVQGKYWQYHFLPGAPALALLAAMALVPIASARRAHTWLPAVASVVALAAIGINLGVVGSWYRRQLAGRPLDDWYAWGGARTQLSGGLPTVGAYIKARTAPGDPILIFAQDAALYTFADRWPPTRFGINLALILGDDRPQRRRFRQEFLTDLAARPPQRIVLWDDDRNTLLRRSSRDYLLEFPEFATVLRERYVRDTLIGPFELLKPR